MGARARSRLILLLLSPGLLGAGLACRDSIIVDRWPQVVVAGTVQTPNGGPVAGAGVVGERREPDCAAALHSRSETTTAADGAFAVRFAEPRGEFTGCVRLFVTQGGSQATLEWPEVHLTPEAGLEVAVTLP